MKKLVVSTLLLCLAPAGGTAFAASGYVMDSGNSVVRTGTGACLHTHSWSEQTAIAECEPEIVAARKAPVEVAAMEVVIQRELKPITLEADALFGFDSAELTEAGRTSLNKVLSKLQDSGGLQDKQITITGYSDRLGPESYNLDLSQRRASAVKEYLVSKGINSQIIDARGLGSANPLVGCDQERGASLINCLAPNRRTSVEFSAMEVLEVQKQAPVNE